MSLTQPLASTSKSLLPSPSTLQSLHLLRSQIFQTSHNPQAIRTGAKYLKRRLRGPAMVRYVSPSVYVDMEKDRWEAAWRGKPLLKKDPHKADKPTKIKEKGGKINLPEGGVVGSKVFSETMGAVASTSSTPNNALSEFRLMRTKNILRNPAFHPASLPSPLHPSTLPGGLPLDNSTDDARKESQTRLREALRIYHASAQANDLVAEGFELVLPGVPGAHLGVAGGKSGRAGAGPGEKVEEMWEWLSDEKERGRREEVRLRRTEGRGPPKKGQGRRSQMKRK